MSNMVKAKKMHNHAVPVIMFELTEDVPCYIVVYFSKVLIYRI